MKLSRGPAQLALLSAVLFAGAASSEVGPGRTQGPMVHPNDNRRPAGRLDNDTLRVTLIAQMATWHPSGDSGGSIQVAAFSASGGPPQIPAPLIRVPTGTIIDARVRNALTDSISLHGLVSHPATADDSLVLAPGSSVRMVFPAGEPGTYLYYAGLVRAPQLGPPESKTEREQLAGGLVVDSLGAGPSDRLFVINIWAEPGEIGDRPNAFAINGRSFPWGETVTAAQGDTLRWRWINASLRRHPMHLHGFYYRVDARGDLLSDSVYAPTARRLVVTEDLGPRQTMSVAWSPDRPGNWLFHCHIGFHVIPAAQLDPPAMGSHAYHSGNVRQHMAGLVLPIVVRPAGSWHPPDFSSPRRLRLLVQEGRPRGRAPRAMGFVLQRGTADPPADSVAIPGSPLILTRGEPTTVAVVNRLREGTAVHWHGIELESYSDGVVGWSGVDRRTAPVIAAGDSFVARLTLRRAGTFIYHTHLNDYEQLTAGLYGAIVVLEPGQRYQPEADHLFIVGWDGPVHLGQTNYLVNGDSLPELLVLARDRRHRIRLVNIGMAGRVQFALLQDSVPVSWRAAALDGADLPPAQATVRPAMTFLPVGQTQDFFFDPPAPGSYRLTLKGPEGGLVWSQALLVR